MSLEDYLSQESQRGEESGSGQFTLARDKALELLGRFQLPSKGAWGLKILQAIVASGSQSTVSINHSRSQISFIFRPLSPLNEETFQQAFFNPAPSQPAYLDHLKRGLWSVGLEMKRDFELSFPDWEHSLRWSGQGFTPVETGPSQGCAHLRFELKTAAIAELQTAIRKSAFSYPLPLHWNEQRLDALQLCPDFGLGERSKPLALGYIGRGTYPLRLPPGTFGEEVQLRSRCKESWEELLSQDVFNLVERPKAYGSVMLSYGASCDLAHNRWKMTPQHSRCYWIRDGVVVFAEDLWEPQVASVALFLSADGLETDLTSLQLRDTPQKAERLRNALGELPMHIFERLLSRPHYKTAIERTKAQRQAAGWMILGGFLATPFTLGASLTVALAGYLKHRRVETRAQNFDDEMQQALKDLRTTMLRASEKALLNIATSAGSSLH